VVFIMRACIGPNNADIMNFILMTQAFDSFDSKLEIRSDMDIL